MQTSDLPKPVADFLCWLADRPTDAVPFLEIPEHLRKPDVLIIAESRGLAYRSKRLPPQRSFFENGPTGFRIGIGQGVGWERAKPSDPPDAIHVALQKEGRMWVAEQRLFAAETGGVATTKGPPVAKLARRKPRRPAVPVEMTEKQEWVWGWREGSPRPSFSRIARLYSDKFGEPITREAVRRIYERARAVKQAQGASVRPRLQYREGGQNSA